MELKEMVLHKLHFTLLPIMHIFKEIDNYLNIYKKNSEDTEPSMIVIIYCYIKDEVITLLKDSPHLLMELYSAEKRRIS